MQINLGHIIDLIVVAAANKQLQTFVCSFG